jgi:hypothetical protein
MKHRLTLCFYFTFFRFFLSSAHCTLSLLVTSTLWPSVNIFSLGDLSNSFRFSVIFSKHRLFPPSYSPLHHSPPPPQVKVTAKVKVKVESFRLTLDNGIDLCLLPTPAKPTKRKPSSKAIAPKATQLCPFSSCSSLRSIK